MGNCGYLGGAEIFAPEATLGAASAAARFGEAPPPLEGPESCSLACSAQFDQNRLARPLKLGAQVCQAPSRGRPGVSKAVIQQLHTKLELVQTFSQLVNARCPGVPAGRPLSLGGSCETAQGRECCRRVHPRRWCGASWRRCRRESSLAGEGVLISRSSMIAKGRKKGKKTEKQSEKKCRDNKVRNSISLKLTLGETAEPKMSQGNPRGNSSIELFLYMAPTLPHVPSTRSPCQSPSPASSRPVLRRRCMGRLDCAICLLTGFDNYLTPTRRVRGSAGRRHCLPHGGGT